MQAVEGLADQPDRLPDRQPLPPGEDLVERLALQVLHGDEVAAVVLAEGVDGDDVGVR